MRWSQVGKRAIREILKQLLLFIISAQMDRTCWACVLVAGRQQRPYLCSLVATLLFCSKRVGKGQGKDGGRLAYWKVGKTMLVPLGWWELILGKGGERWSQWVSPPPAPWTLVLIPAGRRRCCQSPSNIQAVSVGGQLVTREQLCQNGWKQGANIVKFCS